MDDQEVIAALLERWMNDDAFRASFRQDPEVAIKASGVQLSGDGWAAVRAIDWRQCDEELSSRASNSSFSCAPGIAFGP
jgi:putative modified peptide